MKWMLTLLQSVVFQTVISGVFIFILKELIQDFVLLPIKRFKEVIGKIDNRLKYYTNVIANSDILAENIIESSKVMRELSCEFEAIYKQIPFKWMFLFFKIIPEHKLISESASSLIRLSNTGGKKGNEVMNYNEIIKIRKNLNISEI